MGTTKSGWVSVHEELCELSRRRGELDWLEAGALVRALRANVHRHLGFGSFAEYVERLFGYGRRAVDDKLRMALALEELPLLSQALRAGDVSASAARELSRVATAETEKEWLEATQARTVHQVERMVSGRSRGDRPGDAVDPARQRHVLRFEVSAETLAHVREAFAAMRSRSEGRLDDDAVLLLMAREVLAGPADDGRASYQVAITSCEQCRRGFQQAAGELIEVEAAVVQMAHCDAQHIGSVEGAHRQSSSSKIIGADEPPSTHTGRVRHDSAGRGQQPRASQTIPPALRRKVLRRDYGRCVVPGCRHHRFVDVHHLQTRADGGAHDENNLIVMCCAHHRALHHGRLVIHGDVARGLSFRHADGTSYGEAPAPRDVGENERAFLGLRNLGFGESLVTRALHHARSRLGGQKPDAAALIRAALALLVPAS